MAKTRLSIAKADIIQAFANADANVFTRADIDKILSKNRAFWRLAEKTTANEFIDFLLKQTSLQSHKFQLPHRPTIRYAWGEVPTFVIVQSLKPEGYFTHFSALFLHGLTEQIPKTIYLNHEQRASGGGGTLTQQSVDRAFKSKCRISKNVTVFREQQICLVNGQNTNCLGVETIEMGDGGKVRVSNIERTLIDCTVRPIYAGGVHEVARAFSAASETVSINRLTSYLRRLHFTYPYHQAIGYYLERSGKYTMAQLDLLRQFDIEINFYLAHDMRDCDYDPTWKLFVPKGF